MPHSTKLLHLVVHFTVTAQLSTTVWMSVFPFNSSYLDFALCVQDTLSLVSTDPSEINRLQQELASAETARSALAESVTTLEQERQRAEKSVWMTQGELNAMQEQMRSSAAKFEELQQQHSALEQR